MQSYLEEDRHSVDYNWLIQSKSPYLKLLQTNPVNWMEWSEEAFEKARREGKGVFLSVGYSDCQRCNEMDRESFEDEEVAVLLNKSFVSIKLDREEHPDIDSIYWTKSKAITGQSGYPLSIFLTPEKVPYYFWYYTPKSGEAGKADFKEIIKKANSLYRENSNNI
ncbi:uncharacterized protein YyaL (SSP411 family) [Evansella vedderi]|uniref:Uncharacterized protein YyaL (SSP411 family) n=1 Tax=Evansella vedderi TaxID=38282 RepID=A0ABT9ZX10_9BACI|nr:DUF255 domain-containing protein [Evansella vedderi]MDQ0255769.1 uncharacterized protein YyaL (SSP411 family) [Evansella vedderi]